MPVVTGAIGFWLGAGSHLEAGSLRIRGVPQPHRTIYLGSEASWRRPRGWTNSARPTGPDWDEVSDPSFAHGVGCRCKTDGGRAKWNFQGDGFSIWSPRGPDLADLEIRSDGQSLGVVSLRAEQSRGPRRSWRRQVFSPAGIPSFSGRHAANLWLIAWRRSAPPSRRNEGMARTTPTGDHRRSRQPMCR